jgi:rRNA maturation endonuclease Nob1
MMIPLAIALTLGVLVFTLLIRSKDVPAPIPVSPVQHLEDRKAAIYENLRDLQFEYRLGKLSDEDYQRTKLTLQKELAGVLAEMEATAKRLGMTTKRTAPPQKQKAEAISACPHCGAKFPKTMKFCGECGKAMAS